MSSRRSQRLAAIQAKFIRYIDKVTNKISNCFAQRRARHKVSPPYRDALPPPPYRDALPPPSYRDVLPPPQYRDALPPPSSLTRPGSPIRIGSRSEGSLTAENHAPICIGEELTNQRQTRMTSIDTLPDDVLLEIFYFYLYHCQLFIYEREGAWRTMVHVCRRWRLIVFGSQRVLKLDLLCTSRTPARDMLDVWPALPLVISIYGDPPTGNVDNIIAALECTNRVREIHLTVPSLDSDIFGAMQQPFPELTYLDLRSPLRDLFSLERPSAELVPVVPDSFLGGSAPRLKSLSLNGVRFPGLQKLLLSATHLSSLFLDSIPHSGYISPDAMVTVLSTLTSLSHLNLSFQYSRSSPDPASRRPPPSTRFVVPVLKFFRFNGVTEYLEDLVACIDAPQLNALHITFFNDIIFHTPQLVRFISHTPMWKVLKNAYIIFSDYFARVRFSSLIPRHGDLSVEISRSWLDRQVSSLEQVCTSYLPPLFTLEDLYFHEGPYSTPYLRFNIENTQNTQWLELLRPFMAVKNLYLSEKYASCIVPALQELVEGRTTEVLPALQNIFLKGLKSPGSVQESIGQFVAARQVANHPIGISSWTDSDCDS